MKFQPWELRTAEDRDVLRRARANEVAAAVDYVATCVAALETAVEVQRRAAMAEAFPEALAEEVRMAEVRLVAAGYSLRRARAAQLELETDAAAAVEASHG